MKIVQINEDKRLKIFEAVCETIKQFKGTGIILEELELALIDVIFYIRIEKSIQINAITINENPDKAIKDHRQEID
jgi:hypothetical protein